MVIGPSFLDTGSFWMQSLHKGLVKIYYKYTLSTSHFSTISSSKTFSALVSRLLYIREASVFLAASTSDHGKCQASKRRPTTSQASCLGHSLSTSQSCRNSTCSVQRSSSSPPGKMVLSSHSCLSTSSPAKSAWSVYPYDSAPHKQRG